MISLRTMTLASVLLVTTAVATRGQDPGGEPNPDPAREAGQGTDDDDEQIPLEEMLPPLRTEQDDKQQEMIDLIHSIERRLNTIDLRLSDAGAGVVPLEGVEDSGLDDLLRDARDQSRRNIEDIDRVLELAREMGQQSSGAPSQSQQPQGESPLDQERDRGPQERENTPSEPQNSQEQQEQGGQEPQEQPGGETPQDQDQENPENGQNQAGNPDRQEQGSGGTPSNDADRWGELPVRYREVFRNQGGDDLPVQYRDWIDAYHRRLSKTRR